MSNLWFYVHNIPDIGNVRKPFDMFATYKWKGIALELKIVKTQKNPYPEWVLKMLYPHQIANLLKYKWWLSQWISYVIAYHASTNKMYIYDINEEKWEVWLSERIIIDFDSEEIRKHFMLQF